MMNFGAALEALQAGATVTRISWNDTRTNVVMAQEGDFSIGFWSSKDHPPQNYHPTWPDMLAGDWEVVA